VWHQLTLKLKLNKKEKELLELMLNKLIKWVLQSLKILLMNTRDQVLVTYMRECQDRGWPKRRLTVKNISTAFYTKIFLIMIESVSKNSLLRNSKEDLTQKMNLIPSLRELAHTESTSQFLVLRITFIAAVVCLRSNLSATVPPIRVLCSNLLNSVLTSK